MDQQPKRLGQKASSLTIKVLLVIALLWFVYFIGSYGCQVASQWWARSWGGTMTVNLDSGKKLLQVSWKEGSLWVLTRKRRENEPVESYEYAEDSRFTVLQGKVVINEKK